MTTERPIHSGMAEQYFAERFPNSTTHGERKSHPRNDHHPFLTAFIKRRFLRSARESHKETTAQIAAGSQPMGVI